MKVEQIVCDECRQIRQASNGWFKIGVLRPADTVVQLTLGVVPDKPMPNYEVHDICGQRCFHKHIDILLGLQQAPAKQPPPIPEETVTVEEYLLPEAT